MTVVVSRPHVRERGGTSFIRQHVIDYGAVADEERIRLQRQDVEDSIVRVPGATDRVVVCTTDTTSGSGHPAGRSAARASRWTSRRRMVHRPAAMNDQANAALAQALDIAWSGVDYRLAPEWPFPAAVHDCTAAARWLLANAAAEFGTNRAVVIGESAGAQPALLTCSHCATNRSRPARSRSGVQLRRSRSQSHAQPARGRRRPDVLSPDGIEFFTRLYLGG